MLKDEFKKLSVEDQAVEVLNDPRLARALAHKVAEKLKADPEFQAKMSLLVGDETGGGTPPRDS